MIPAPVNMNTEQLTQMVNELQTMFEGQRQELVRRAQEHQAQHSALEETRRMLGAVESRVEEIAMGRNLMGARTGPTQNIEAMKRLDRWAATMPGN